MSDPSALLRAGSLKVRPPKAGSSATLSSKIGASGMSGRIASGAKSPEELEEILFRTLRRCSGGSKGPTPKMVPKSYFS
jgi:hypothetical protein